MAKRPTPRAELTNVAAEVHGGPDSAELRRLGVAPHDLLDFSVCVNPYGPAPGVRAALAGASIDRYPDRDCVRLRAALAEAQSLRPTQILVGNGSTELIAWTVQAFLAAGDRVLVLGPTYGEYARAARLCGANVEALIAPAEAGFQLHPELVAHTLFELEPRVVFLCRPNNPTGSVIDLPTLQNWATQHPATLYVVDEAYLAFGDKLESAVLLAKANMLVLRSMTKDHAFAGLRLGYAVAEEYIIEALKTVRTPWSVSTPAQDAGVAALRSLEHLVDSLGKLAAAKDDLVRGVERLGLSVAPSRTHYFLVDVGDGAEWRRRLLEHKILVRDCASFGLPAYIRIAARTVGDNGRLLDALQVVKNKTGAT